jgi:hypothetical protein
MSRSDRRRWVAARAVADLGSLMALWLEGEIRSQPGYQPRCGPDEETAGLVPTLAAANRAGFLTTCSQPGHGPRPGFDGATWAQRAAVQGHVADPAALSRLLPAAGQAGLLVSVPGLVPGPWGDGVTVTTRDDGPYTSFGGHLTRRDLRVMWPTVGRDAFAAVERAWQVTLVDPEYGRDDVLWPVLDTLAEVTQ